ncbi:MAG TPA: hypothetical protein VJT82_05835 [Pyrinomonadaceae bacterium]|nr:hypothetical protein [Pyrinomonadaceae bacterium]
MRFFVVLWLAVEVLQIGLIGMLLVGYRRLQRRLDEGYQFSQRPPRSVTEE